MAAPGRDKVVHQDYIVRQRYSNALPPPHMPPKLLDIPTDGLDYYCSPAFASRIAKSEPLNIEADAFLGMTIDLVGMPGIFDGDESSIQAPLVPPPVHPKDRNLLRPLKSLGMPKTETGAVSFLRRTQYTAEERGRIDVKSSRNASGNAIKRRKPTDSSKDEPINILRSAIKGFDIANPEDAYKGPDTQTNIRGAVPTAAEIDAWKNPKHPTKPNLKVLDTYPLIPDLDAITDTNGFMVAKFAGNPTDANDEHDERIDVAILRPLHPNAEAIAEQNSKLAAYKADPVHNTKPGLPPMRYELFLPEDKLTAQRIKQKFDIDNPDRDDPALYTTATEDDGENNTFRFHHSRVYETGHQTDLHEHPYQETALALHDPDLARQLAGVKMDDGAASTTRLQKAAYFYPLNSRQQLKPRRDKALAAMGILSRFDDDNPRIDVIDVEIRSPDDEEQQLRERFRDEIDVAE